MARKRQIMRNPNNFGTIKKLSGNRSRPYMVGVNPRINDKGSYSYDILGYFEDRTSAMIALAEYNKEPVNLSRRDLTFTEVYQAFFRDKYVDSKKQLSKASETATTSAYKNCSVLHNRRFYDIRHMDLQRVIDDCPLKHASLENILTLFKGMYAFAMREDIVQKNHSEFVKINIPNDDEHGIRFADSDVALLWANTDIFYVKVILIYLYTGWRATELSEMPKANVDLNEWTMTGGKKTKAGKGRIVPIHPRIRTFVEEVYGQTNGEYLFQIPGRKTPMSYAKMVEGVTDAMNIIGIKTKYTLHDCRHTFASWLDDAGVSTMEHNLLMGHAGKTLDERVYLHKTIEQLRIAINKLP